MRVSSSVACGEGRFYLRGAEGPDLQRRAKAPWLEEPARRPRYAVVLLELQYPFVAEVAADAALLEPAEGRAKVLRQRAMAVEIGIAGLQPPRQPQRALAVARPHRGAQAEIRVVGEPRSEEHTSELPSR